MSDYFNGNFPKMVRCAACGMLVVAGAFGAQPHRCEPPVFYCVPSDDLPHQRFTTEQARTIKPVMAVTTTASTEASFSINPIIGTFTNRPPPKS